MTNTYKVDTGYRTFEADAEILNKYPNARITVMME